MPESAVYFDIPEYRPFWASVEELNVPFYLHPRLQISDRAPRWVPWAWGINGCASVLSAILATLLAIHFGFTLVVALAMALYVLAAATFATHDGLA